MEWIYHSLARYSVFGNENIMSTENPVSPLYKLPTFTWLLQRLRRNLGLSKVKTPVKQGTSMDDPQETSGNLSSQRSIRSRKCDKKRQCRNSKTPNKKDILTKLAILTGYLYTSKAAEKLQADECSNIYYYDKSKQMKYGKRMLKKLINENKTCQYDKTTLENKIVTREYNNNTIPATGNENKLHFDGFKHDGDMNIHVRDEEDQVDDNCCQDKIKYPEKARLEENVSNNNNTSSSDKTHEKPQMLILFVDTDEQNSIKQSLEGIKDVSNQVVHSKEYEAKQFETEEKDEDKIELMRFLLSQRHFKIKTDILVYMEVKSLWHPRAIDDIPWSWLNEEKWRLHTYSRYPHGANKSAILLAEAGFAYLGSGKGNDDRVICHFCLVVKEHWRSSDVISVVHKDLSPECSMITGLDCNNVPMTAPECGLSLFYQLNNSKNILTNDIGGIKAGHEGDKVGIETDSHLDSEQRTSQRRPSLPGQAVGNAVPAHLVKPLQMASQTVMRASAPSSYQSAQMTSSHSQSSITDVRPSAMSSHINTTSSSLNQVASSTSQIVDAHESQNNRSAGVRSAASGTGTSQQTSLQNFQQQAVPTATFSSSTTVSLQANEDASSGQQNPSTLSTATNNSTSSSTMSQSTNQPQGQGNTSQTATGETQNTSRAAGRGPTYGELGIITERPKRFEYAVRAKRYDSFEPWPRDHHMKKEDLADAGFYYAGYGDCARCFYCGGGLRNWEDNDNVWVEHARWFPKCAFIRQAMGQQFVDAVQDLNRDHDQISFEMVTQKMGSSAASFQLDTKNMPLKRDPAVITVLDMGYSEKDVLEAANFVKESNGVLSADKLYEKLQQDGKSRAQKEIPADSQAIRSATDVSKDEVVMNQLKEKNNQLRQQTICKICMDKEVAVVFLPCGHLVSCTDCAAALKDCPVCRNPVRGIVRAFMA